MTEPAIIFRALALLKKENVDPLQDSFADMSAISAVVQKMGTGKTAAVILAAAFARKLAAVHGAFWFMQREAPLGLALGFPDVLLSLSPVALAEAALEQGDIGVLDTRLRELDESLNRQPSHDGIRKLSPMIYQELFDPEFVRFVVVDTARVEQALAMSAGQAARELREAIASVITEPAQRTSIEAAWVDPIQNLDDSVALSRQISRAPRAIERFVRMFATVSASAPAAATFWSDKVFDSASLEKGCIFGVFPRETTRPLLDEAGIPRVYFVDAAQLEGRLEGGDLSAEQWRANLRRLSRSKGALAFVRATGPDMAQEAIAPVRFAT